MHLGMFGMSTSTSIQLRLQLPKLFVQCGSLDPNVLKRQLQCLLHGIFIPWTPRPSNPIMKRCDSFPGFEQVEGIICQKTTYTTLGKSFCLVVLGNKNMGRQCRWFIASVASSNLASREAFGRAIAQQNCKLAAKACWTKSFAWKAWRRVESWDSGLFWCILAGLGLLGFSCHLSQT